MGSLEWLGGGVWRGNCATHRQISTVRILLYIHIFFKVERGLREEGVLQKESGGGGPRRIALAVKHFVKRIYVVKNVENRCYYKLRRVQRSKVVFIFYTASCIPLFLLTSNLEDFTPSCNGANMFYLRVWRLFTWIVSHCTLASCAVLVGKICCNGPPSWSGLCFTRCTGPHGTSKGITQPL